MATEKTSGACGRCSADSDCDDSSTADNTAIVQMAQQSSRSRECICHCRSVKEKIIQVSDKSWSTLLNAAAKRQDHLYGTI